MPQVIEGDLGVVLPGVLLEQPLGRQFVARSGRAPVRVPRAGRSLRRCNQLDSCRRQQMPHWLRWILTQPHRLRRERPQIGRLTAIFVADQASAPMRSCVQASAVVDAGLAEDRYAMGRGFWRLTDGCQVTLIHAEDLTRAQRRRGLLLDAGQHRRNLVVSGLAQTELRDRDIRIGDALFEWHRVRPPCGYLDRVSGPGTAKALFRSLSSRSQVGPGQGW